MKTAEEWCNEMGFLGNGYIQVIKQIQLDAWKQGMSDAAEIEFIAGVKNESFYFAIMTARDQRTSI